MCVVSMIHDHYEPMIPRRLPNIITDPPVEPSRTLPGLPVPAGGSISIPSTWINPSIQQEIEELKKLIAEFKEALAAAKRIDELTNQPDCLDPKKAGLEKRVAMLEKQIAEYQKIIKPIKAKKPIKKKRTKRK